MGKLLLNVVIACVLSSCLARTDSPCRLASALKYFGMAPIDIMNFVCIAAFESDFRAVLINPAEDGGEKFGLFQINNKEWCDDDFGNNKCHMQCADLLDENLRDDIACIKTIIRETEATRGLGTGLSAWKSYVEACIHQYHVEALMIPCLGNSSIDTPPDIPIFPLNVKENPSPQETTNERESSQNGNTSENETESETEKNSDAETADSPVVYKASAPLENQPLPYVQQVAHPQIYQRTYHQG